MRVYVEVELYNLVDCVAAQTGRTLQGVVAQIVRRIERRGAVRILEPDSRINCSILPGTRILKAPLAEMPSGVTATELRRSMAVWCLQALGKPVVRE
jgi:hypothetical protein